MTRGANGGPLACGGPVACSDSITCGVSEAYARRLHRVRQLYGLRWLWPAANHVPCASTLWPAATVATAWRPTATPWRAATPAGDLNGRRRLHGLR